jgi:hypothetical protein
VKEKLEETAIPGWRNAGEVFKERAREMASFYSWEKIDDHFRINIKKNAVSQRVNRMGKFFLFSMENVTGLNVLPSTEKAVLLKKDLK